MSWGRVLDRDVGDVDGARRVFQLGIDSNRNFGSLYQVREGS